MLTHRFPRRATTTAAAALALAITLTACGGGDDGGGDGPADLTDNEAGAMEDYGVGDQFTATEPLSFSVLYSDHPNYPIQDDWLFWSELTERTGVTLEPTVVPLSDYEQKRSLIIGAGDAPLIIPKTYPGQEEPFVSSGAILPVSDYFDLMPNFQAKVEEWDLQENLDAHRQQDGKIYVLPGLHENVWQDYTVAMRTDVLAELGLEPPADWDEFRDVLAAIKAAHPGGYPFSDRFNQTDPGGNILNIVGMTFGTKAGWGFDHVTWDADAGEFAYTGATDEYRAMIEYFHSLVADGLMDPESFTQDEEAAVQKFVTGQSYAISTNAQTLVNEYRQPLTDSVPGATVAKIPLPAGPAGDVLNSESRLENGIMIGSAALDSPNFVAMMQFIDWLWYSDAGQEFAKWGVEGVTYTKGPDGTRVLAENIDFVGMNPDAPEHLQRDYGFSGGVFAYGGTTELLQSTFSEEEREFQAAMADKDLLPVAPPHPFTEAEREQLTLVETPLKDYVYQMTLQFILGQRDLSEWDAYVAELEGKGMATYVDTVNAAQQRYESENG